jgi:hypothetical protein
MCSKMRKQVVCNVLGKQKFEPTFWTVPNVESQNIDSLGDSAVNRLCVFLDRTKSVIERTRSAVRSHIL